MSLPRHLVREIRRLDPPQLRRLLILARGLLIGADGAAVQLKDIPGFPAVSYRRQTVRCGRRCSGCPHGPYWYAHWKEGHASRSQYIGATLPAEIARMLAGGGQAGEESIAGRSDAAAERDQGHGRATAD